MLSDINTTTVIGGVRIVNNPELIKVKTINKRIVEQMTFLDGEAGMREVKPIDFKKIGIIGVTNPYRTLVVVTEGGRFYRVRSLAYLSHLMEVGHTHEQANALIDQLPQIFEA